MSGMRLITELNEDVKVIAEEADDDTGKKSYYIEGIFMQGNIKNRNGRRYPMEVLEREVARYSKDFIAKHRAFGELGHPEGPTINLPKISHIITSLKREGDNFVGKAKITVDTPNGAIVKSLIDEGAQLAVSSRGMGSLKSGKDGVNEVQNDFYLATAGDIVADPSAPNAFVNGIMENKEWVWENGLFREADLAETKKEISKTSRADMEDKCVEVFARFLSKI